MVTQKQNKAILSTGFIVGIVGVILATLLLCKHGFPELCTSSFGCSIEGVDGCQRLGESSESKIFGVIPIAFFGLLYYVFLTALIGFQVKKPTVEKATLLLVTTIFGLIVDAILGYINFTQLLIPCILCAYTYLITLALFILSLTHYLQMNRSKEKPNLGSILHETINPLIIGLAIPLLISFGFWSVDRMKAPAEVADSLLSEEKVESTLADLSALQEVNLNLNGIHSVEGAENGYIVIQKFADFLCPHCYHASQLLQEAMKRWPGRIKVYYRHFPLDSTCNPELHGKPNKPMGDWRCNGAQAAICAADYPKFPEFYHGIFEFQRQNLPITLEQLERLSQSNGLPWPQIQQCMGSVQTQQKLIRDITDAVKIKINSTPTLILNNRLLPAGTPDRIIFLHLIDALVYQKEGGSAYQEYRNRNK